MATVEVELGFPDQLQESRKKIRDCFKRSHEALQVRENILLSRVDEIEREYNSINQKMAKLVESLEQHSSLSSDTPTDNELNETYQQIYSVIDAKIKTLKQQTLTSIEFEWDTQLKSVIEQLGSIKVNGHTSKAPNFPPGVKPVIPDYKAKQIPSVSCCKYSTREAPGELNNPRGIGVHYKTGNVYIADTDNHCIQVFSCNGEYIFMFNISQFIEAYMNTPVGICISQDKVFVALFYGHEIIVYDLKGNLIRSIGRHGSGAVQFDHPRAIDVSDKNNNIYVCEYGNGRVQILTEEFKYFRMFGIGTLRNPRDIKVTRDRVMVLDENDPCMFIFNSCHVVTNRLITRGEGKQARDPYCFDLDRDYNIILSDFGNHCVYVLNQEGGLIHQFGKKGQCIGDFCQPFGIALDNKGRIIVVCQKKENCLQFF